MDPCPYTIVWRCQSTTRRNGSADRLKVSQHRQASRHTKLPYFWLLLSTSLCTVRDYTSNVTLLILGTLIKFLVSNNSILKHPEPKILIHILHILKFTTSQLICVIQVSSHIYPFINSYKTMKMKCYTQHNHRQSNNIPSRKNT